MTTKKETAQATAADIKEALFALSNPEKKAFLPYFFKTGPGQYGEGDKFIGVVVPQQRALVKDCGMITLHDIETLLHDEYHECRITALFFLVKRFKKAKTDDEQRQLYDFYIANHAHINNWDLVDLSAPDIVGGYLFERDRDDLRRFAQSDNLWLQRIAIVATYFFIKNRQLDDTFDISTLLLHHRHDLIHKAVGWMLREAGKRDIDSEIAFLTDGERYKTMPRTMLRYAIEKFDEPLRQDFLKGRV